MKMKASDYIAEFLAVQETTHVFEMAGGMITHILDSLHKRPGVKVVSIHHEQTAAFAADAYGRCTGRPGVAMATSGPGATNLLTGIGSCYFDSSPALFITGQVNIHEQKGDRKIRQLGFQETDIVAMAEPITKKCFRLRSADDLEATLQEAYKIAIGGRPGPVLIDIPMNLQRVEIDVAPIKTLFQSQSRPPQTAQSSLDTLYQAIGAARRPLILAGGGLRCARSLELFGKFAELTKLPVVTSLQAVDALPFNHPLRVGFIGSYGNRWANIALGTCDLLVVLGSRLDIRQTGADVASFCQDKTIVHVDCEEGEVNNRVPGCVPILADLKNFFEDSLAAYAQLVFPEHSQWLQEIATSRLKWPDTDELQGIGGINPNLLMNQLSAVSGAAAGYVADVGNHQMWAAQSLQLAKGQIFMTSGGMGAMGFALPAAVGACMAQSNQPFVVIAGDGGFQLNLQELQTVVRNELPLKILVLNNQNLGMIRQFQDSYFESRYQSTYWGYSAPNFEAVAGAYGIAAKSISQPEEVQAALEWLWSQPDQPALLQVAIDPHANAYPKIAFGKPITEMEPFSKPLDMEGT